MKIIPVIDYLNGKAVLAEKGNRKNYQPINSKLCGHCDLFNVIESILSLAKFNVIYIADLDCIEKKQLNTSLWKDLLKSFPYIEFWFDFGSLVSSWHQLMSNVTNARPIIGSESFADLYALSNAIDIVKESHPILSIDIKDKKILGPRNLLEEFNLWPQDIIILSLDRVGSLEGPDINALTDCKAQFVNCNLYAGGGIRNIQDIQQLENLKYAGVLLAKSLHDGTLERKDLTQLVVNNF